MHWGQPPLGLLVMSAHSNFFTYLGHPDAGSAPGSATLACSLMALQAAAGLQSQLLGLGITPSPHPAQAPAPASHVMTAVAPPGKPPLNPEVLIGDVRRASFECS
jgi:hypothetical protein